MPTLHLEIVTPEGPIFRGDVESVQLPGAEGELGILPLHAPLLTQLIPGELEYVVQGKTIQLAIGDGFAEVMPEEVSVLTDLAIAPGDINENAVQEALTRAENALRSKTLIGEELEATQATIARSIAQLRLKRRR